MIGREVAVNESWCEREFEALFEHGTKVISDPPPSPGHHEGHEFPLKILVQSFELSARMTGGIG
jgi:hypothetical protein